MLTPILTLKGIHTNNQTALYYVKQHSQLLSLVNLGNPTPLTFNYL